MSDLMIGKYCELGWKLLALHGVVRPAVCSCHLGDKCATPGKHPIASAWQSSATSDEERVLSWMADGKQLNIGVLLGGASGIIDVELDGDDAKKSWDSLGLGEVWTPTYRAGRGPHRLFQWRDDLPPITSKKCLGIEFRLGNGRACQSVLPPSVHHSGRRYEWIEGMSPYDVEVAPLPEKLLRLIWNADEPGGSPRQMTKAPAAAILHRRVTEGNRNNELHRYACAQAFRCKNINDPQEQQDLLTTIGAINQIQCSPPLGQEEVIAIYRSAVHYVRQSICAGIPVERAMMDFDATKTKKKKGEPAPRNLSGAQVFTLSGLQFEARTEGGEPEYWPGEWRLTIVHSDPLEYRLHVPAWMQWTPSGSGNISLTVSQYRSAPKVAHAVLAATGTVMLDDEPGLWNLIWDGSGKKAKRHIRGLKAKLLELAGHEFPGASSLRYVTLAGWLYDRLSQAAQPNDEDTPDPTGRAAWRGDGTLWFNWTKVWEDIERNHKVVEGERLALKRRLLAKIGSDVRDFKHAEFRHPGGARKKYVVWTIKEFASLEEMATEEPQDFSTGDKKTEAPQQKHDDALPAGPAAGDDGDAGT